MNRDWMVLGLSMALGAYPTFAAADERVRQIGYDPEAVVALDFCLGFQTTIVFGPGETIENVAIGDASRFQAIANRSATILFVKPTTATAVSNMTVITTKYRYSFALRVVGESRCPGAQTIFNLSFNYPPEPQAETKTEPEGPGQGPPTSQPAASATDTAPVSIPLPQPARNAAYTYEGSAALVPKRVYDDGSSTYFKWANGDLAPAIYAFDEAGRKALVNYSVAGDTLVLDLVAPEFELKSGQLVTLLFNEGYRPRQLDSESPKPRVIRHRRRFVFF